MTIDSPRSDATVLGPTIPLEFEDSNEYLRQIGMLLQDIPATATGTKTARSIADRFKDIGNVKDWGAKGDGVTDDTTALKRALANYDRLYAPPGTYIVSAPLLYQLNTHLEGAGFGSTIFSATHAGDVFAPDDDEGRHLGLRFANFAITKTGANAELGNGIWLTSSRQGVFDSIEISDCDIGILFKPKGASTYSYFNEFRGTRIFSNTTSAVKVDTFGNGDIPNANLFIGGDWRGGTTVCDLVAGSGQRLVDTSIQGAGTDWIHLRAGGDDSPSGTILIGCRFENSSAAELLTGGIRIGVETVQIIGGSSSKGQIIPYIDGGGGTTRFIGHKHAGAQIPDDWAEGAVDGSLTFGDNITRGLFQNYLLRSNGFNNTTTWAPPGVSQPVTRNSGQADRAGGTRAYKLTYPGSNRYIEQVTSTTAASATVCFSVWMRADTDGYIKIAIFDEATPPDSEEATVWLTDKWRRFWVWKTFGSGATGNVVVRIWSNGDPYLTTIYVDDAQLNDGKVPGATCRTTTTTETGTTTILYMENATHDAPMRALALASLPTASASLGRMYLCTDETGGPVPVYSDGTNWRRVSDGVVAS